MVYQKVKKPVREKEKDEIIDDEEVVDEEVEHITEPILESGQTTVTNPNAESAGQPLIHTTTTVTATKQEFKMIEKLNEKNIKLFGLESNSSLNPVFLKWMKNNLSDLLKIYTPLKKKIEEIFSIHATKKFSCREYCNAIRCSRHLYYNLAKKWSGDEFAKKVEDKTKNNLHFYVLANCHHLFNRLFNRSIFCEHYRKMMAYLYELIELNEGQQMTAENNKENVKTDFKLTAIEVNQKIIDLILKAQYEQRQNHVIKKFGIVKVPSADVLKDLWKYCKISLKKIILQGQYENINSQYLADVLYIIFNETNKTVIQQYVINLLKNLAKQLREYLVSVIQKIDYTDLTPENTGFKQMLLLTVLNIANILQSRFSILNSIFVYIDKYVNIVYNLDENKTVFQMDTNLLNVLKRSILYDVIINTKYATKTEKNQKLIKYITLDVMHNPYNDLMVIAKIVQLLRFCGYHEYYFIYRQEVLMNELLTNNPMTQVSLMFASYFDKILTELSQLTMERLNQSIPELCSHTNCIIDNIGYVISKMEKTVFSTYYKRDLAKRMIFNYTHQKNIEKLFLEKLLQFLQKKDRFYIKTMVDNITESQKYDLTKIENIEINLSQKDHLAEIKNNGNYVRFDKNNKNLHFIKKILKPLVISEYAWPTFKKTDYHLKLPFLLKIMKASFNKFYQISNPRFRLNWKVYTSSMVFHLKGEYKLIVEPLFGIILMTINRLLQDQKNVNANNLKKMLKDPKQESGLEENEIEKILQKLWMFKILLYNQETKQYTFNPNFESTDKIIYLQMKNTIKQNVVVKTNLIESESFPHLDPTKEKNVITKQVIDDLLTECRGKKK